MKFAVDLALKPASRLHFSADCQLLPANSCSSQRRAHLGSRSHFVDQQSFMDLLLHLLNLPRSTQPHLTDSPTNFVQIKPSQPRPHPHRQCTIFQARKCHNQAHHSSQSDLKLLPLQHQHCLPEMDQWLHFQLLMFEG